MKICRDTKEIIDQGRTSILHVLCELRKVFAISGNFRYILNDLFIDDYCHWIQSVEENIIKWLQSHFSDCEIDKSFVGLDLESLEIQAKMEEMKLTTIDSDDENTRIKSPERDFAAHLDKEIERHFHGNVATFDNALCERRLDALKKLQENAVMRRFPHVHTSGVFGLRLADLEKASSDENRKQMGLNQKKGVLRQLWSSVVSKKS
ncbi:unnamed protein product [Caenorhabditis auriculariae]|uniref:Protein SHQ1 homolog n=1 Tax=Caenorhabditis auriculariae TaxID=2777116 RepID=A0A8S1H7Y9_9PELO|nr:unnamed protein product [Caenorhabditis auriculariae]